MGKKTLVLGASDHPNRYSYLAVHRLVSLGHAVVAIGLKPAMVHGIPIQTGLPAVDAIDTVTLYINPLRQPAYYDYILGIRPQRVIFNPGTENDSFAEMLQANGIKAMEACTLVMLSTGNY
jgi:predicted CoA-binding protein